jgi:hypothetical protein
MKTIYPFTSSQLTASLRRSRLLALGLVALLLYASLFGLTSPAFGDTSTHGCAPNTPPPVANAVPLQTSPGLVLINEALSQPASNWNCSEPNKTFTTQNDGWVEFYNPQNQAFDLYAAHARISLDGGSTYIYFAFGTAIAADGFLVVFPQYNQTIASSPPWNIILSVSGTIIDQATMPQLQADQSYARVPDGSTNWLYCGHPTIDASNSNCDQPVTPTPTKTPKPTQTPKPTKTPKVSTTSGNGTARPASSGTQPAWSNIQFPSDSTPTLDMTSTAGPTTQLLSQPQDPPPQSNGPNGWLIALLACLSLLLLAVPIGIWRRLRSP